MMKSLLALYLFSVLPCLAAGAERADEDISLLVSLSDGTTVSCAFAQRPQMTFTGKALTLGTDEGEVGSWTFDAVSSWTFLKETSGIGAAKRAEDDIVFKHGQALVRNAGDAGKEVAVYDAAGREVLLKKISGRSSAVIPLSPLPTGAYLLRAGGVTIKFCIK